MVYAVVRAGGRQEKVEVGSIVVLDRIQADKNGNVELVPVLFVDGDKITTDADKLAKVKVTAEVVKDSVLAENPWIAKSLYNAFDQAKKEWLERLNSGERWSAARYFCR